MPQRAPTPPPHADACLLLADGTAFFGTGFGTRRDSTGEICFNTAMTGYQEVLTDPSYAGQIITFTFPHIGNVGCNAEDFESKGASCAGLVVREPITAPSNYRSTEHLDAWLKRHDIPGISGVDTRALTRHIREHGAQNAMIVAGVSADALKERLAELRAYPSMAGLDLAKGVTTEKSYEWSAPLWQHAPSPRAAAAAPLHVVAVDYGIKHNILRNLAEAGCRVTVVPATAAAADILALKPDGVFLSNGPGDPAATGEYALPEIRALVSSGVPIFGICLGHQLLGLALGAKTEKMTQGHRGANHPVKDLKTGAVLITSQNHGFVVSDTQMPSDLEVTHRSLFDGTVQGLRHKTLPIFCMQGHPEASPGPHEAVLFFQQFTQLMQRKAAG